MSARAGAYAAVLVATTLATLVVTPLMRRLAVRTGVVQAPGERRVHTRPTALFGGLAMGVGLLVGMVVAWRIDAFHDIFFLPNGTLSTEPIGLIVAAVLMLAVGTIDDVREVSAPAKTAGIVLCASILVFAGISLIVFRFPELGVVYLSSDWSYLLSVVWVYGMTTAINFIDGLDGLAAGIVAIGAGAFFLYTMQLTDFGIIESNNIGPLLAIITVGLCLGFLPFNFHPARIFMGDGGALLLGLMLAASTMVVGGRVGPEYSFKGQSWFFFAPLLIPLLILGVPIFDTFLAIVRRAAKGTAPSTADKEHIHHRLMRLGHGQRRSVLILWAWTALLSGLVLFPIYTDRATGTWPIAALALGLVLYTVFHPVVRRERDERRNGNGNGATNGEEPVVVITDEPALDLDAEADRAASTGGAHRGPVDPDGPAPPPARPGRHGRVATPGRHYRTGRPMTPEEALAGFDPKVPRSDRPDRPERPAGEPGQGGRGGRPPAGPSADDDPPAPG